MTRIKSDVKRNKSDRGFAAIGLFNPKFEGNVGGAMRAAACYGAKAIYLIKNRNPLSFSKGKLKKISSDTCKAYKHIPTSVVDCLFENGPIGCMPVAVELSDKATNIFDFTHQPRSLYIFGPEDGSIPPKILDRCPVKIYVPTSFCMNLAATVNVVLFHRMMQLHKKIIKFPVSERPGFTKF